MEQEDLSSYKELKSQGAKAALRLLERKPDQAYLEMWTTLLAASKPATEKKGVTVIIFRLGNEWLAINSVFFCEVISKKKIHRIPHRTNAVILGLVNYQGMLKLCVNMHNFLGIQDNKEMNSGSLRGNFPRMVSIQKDSDLWIFSVDEVHGVFRADIDRLQGVPVTISKSKACYLRGMIEWQGKHVSYIDEELLFFGLKRGVL